MPCQPHLSSSHLLKWDWANGKFSISFHAPSPVSLFLLLLNFTHHFLDSNAAGGSLLSLILQVWIATWLNCSYRLCYSQNLKITVITVSILVFCFCTLGLFSAPKSAKTWGLLIMLVQRSQVWNFWLLNTKNILDVSQGPSLGWARVPLGIEGQNTDSQLYIKKNLVSCWFLCIVFSPFFLNTSEF